VSYRDDLEAARARISSLERELGQAKESIRALESPGTASLARSSPGALARTDPRSATARALGAPTQLSIHRILAGEFDSSDFPKVVAHLQQTYGAQGHFSALEGLYSWSTGVSGKAGPAATYSISVAEGHTTLRAEQNLSQSAAAIFGGIGGGVGGGAVMVPGLLFMISPAAGAVGVCVWLGGVFAGCRALYRRSHAQHERRMKDSVDTLAQLIHQAMRAAGERAP